VSPVEAPVLGDTGCDAVRAAAESLLGGHWCPHCHQRSNSLICLCILTTLPPQGGSR